jgi:hypothetical protein
MSGTLPTPKVATQVTLTSGQPTRVSVGHSFKRSARTSGAQRWAIKKSWSALTRPVFAQLHAFLISQRGQADPFTTTLEGYTTPQGSWLGTPVVSGAGQTGRSIALSGFTASQTGVAKAGDLLKFAGHSKVYMVTADANSSAGGLATLAIEPALIASPANAEALITGNVPFTVALASDSLDTTVSIGGFFSLDIDLVETW